MTKPRSKQTCPKWALQLILQPFSIPATESVKYQLNSILLTWIVFELTFSAKNQPFPFLGGFILPYQWVSSVKKTNKAFEQNSKQDGSVSQVVGTHFVGLKLVELNLEPSQLPELELTTELTELALWLNRTCTNHNQLLHSLFRSFWSSLHLKWNVWKVQPVSKNRPFFASSVLCC